MKRKKKKRKQSDKKQVEFSKIIFIAVSALTVVITFFSCCMIWRTGDTSALAYLIPAVFAEMGAATGFYYSKAKAENQIKLMSKYGQKPEAADFEAN